MILTQMDLFQGEAHSSEILDAVRWATPESCRAFEERYGPITTMRARIVEGGSEETERIRLEAQSKGWAFLLA
jgi:hypothetical protein